MMGSALSASKVGDAPLGNARSQVPGPKVGFQVLQIEPSSPADKAGLQPYFDYIIAVNDKRIESEMPNVVAQEAKGSVDRAAKFTVYNARRDELRSINVTPSISWGGGGLLGCSIRFAPFEHATDLVWHVIEVYPKSPAMTAGLVPLNDWILGSPDVVVRSEDDFYNLLVQNKKRPIKLAVYNSRTDSCRIVAIVPDLEWGGNGILGCDVASGILHRVPTVPSNAQVFQPVDYQSGAVK